MAIVLKIFPCFSEKMRVDISCESSARQKIRLDISCESSASQKIHMKHQTLFSSNDKVKIVKVSSAVVVFPFS